MRTNEKLGITVWMAAAVVLFLVLAESAIRGIFEKVAAALP